MEKFKVAIADDHKLFRKGIIALLSDFSDISEIAEAENGQQLLELVRQEQPQVILLDLNMPIVNGWAVLTELKLRKSRAGVIILSMYEEESIIVNAIKAGARGFLSKNAEPEEIILAIQSVMQTGYYFNDRTDRAMLRKLVAHQTIEPIAPNNSIELTEDEDKVLQLISGEMNTTEIAEKLCMGTRSVERVRQRLLEKFGAKNPVGLVLNAAKRGFIQL
jgi:DNA-binding NarL/FixJ family response regulator